MLMTDRISSAKLNIMNSSALIFAHLLLLGSLEQILSGKVGANGDKKDASMLGLRLLEEKLCPKKMQLDLHDAMRPQFVLVTAQGETRFGVDEPAEAIKRRGFEPGRYTTIFLHGYRETYNNNEWLKRSKILFQRLVPKGNDNAIIMDWGLAAAGYYPAVVARAHILSTYLAELISKLTDELGADYKRIHLIGHSMGAHISGLAGKKLNGRIGRITALDPAGPCFGKYSFKDSSERLAPTDAIEVDAYHYDDSKFGLSDQVGQFDVYVNGGSEQPGSLECPRARFKYYLGASEKQALDIAHARSRYVASADLSLSQCQQVAYECLDNESFINGECGTCDDQNRQCFFMAFAHQYANATRAGLRVSNRGKRLFISTSEEDPFCAHHYQILVKFSEHPELAELAKSQRWRIKVELANEEGEQYETIHVTNRMEYNVFSYLLLSDGHQRPKRITSAQLELQQANGAPARKPDAIEVTEVRVNFMSNVEAGVRRALSSRLCPLKDESKGTKKVKFSTC